MSNSPQKISRQQRISLLRHSDGHFRISARDIRRSPIKVSTLSREIACQAGAILLSEDEWLKNLYPDEIENFEDYIKYSSRLKPLLKLHVQNMLDAGISVVMDFPGNTEKQRTWFKEIYAGHDFSHKLIYLEASDSLCLNQLESRRKTHPERARFDTEVVFHQVTSYFQPPSEHECFNVEVICRENV